MARNLDGSTALPSELTTKSASEVRADLLARREIALLDVREEALSCVRFTSLSCGKLTVAAN